MHHTDFDETFPTARIPADVSREDRILGPFTARQTAILAATAAVLWLGYYATRLVFAPLAYLALATPVAVVVTAIAVSSRDGIGMDRFVLAALQFWRSPRRRVHAPEGVPDLPDLLPPQLAAQAPVPAALHLPCQRVMEAGVLDLGRDGHAALAACSTVNFDLRTGAEQQLLTAGFARWLNSLTGPAQILIRAHRLDLQPMVEQLVQTAPGLPHPALEAAALAHAGFLNELATHRDLLARQALLVLREPPGPAGRRSTGAGPARARHRVAEASRALAAAEITTTALDARHIAAALTDAAPSRTTAVTFQAAIPHEGEVPWPSAH